MEHEAAQFEQAQDYLSQIEGELKERSGKHIPTLWSRVWLRTGRNRTAKSY